MRPGILLLETLDRALEQPRSMSRKSGAIVSAIVLRVLPGQPTLV